MNQNNFWCKCWCEPCEKITNKDMVCGTPTDDTKWCEQCSWKQRKESIKE